MSETVIILPVLYDLMLWFGKKLAHYPQKFKYNLGERIFSSLLEVLERVIEAKYSTASKKSYFLRDANLLLEKLRFLIRMSQDLQCITTKDYEFAALKINEIGKMIGGWEKQNNVVTQSSSKGCGGSTGSP